MRAFLRLGMAAIVFRIITVLFGRFVGTQPAAVSSPSSLDLFGLYPLLTRELTRVAGGFLTGPATPGLVISWLAFAAAIGMLWHTARLDMDEDRADGAALLAAVFPFASVFGHANADALFLLFAAAAFFAFRQQRWIAGGICGALATATLPAGILLLPGLAWTGWRGAGPNRRVMLIGLLIAACGIAGYLTYLYYLGGPPGGWATASAGWGMRFHEAPWMPFRALLAGNVDRLPVFTLNAAMTLLFLLAVPVVWWRFDGGYALYMLAMLLLPLTSGRYEALGRVCALLFPVFLLVAGVRWRIVMIGAAITSAMFYALLLTL